MAREGFVRVKHEKTGAEADVPRAAMAHWRKLGWVAMTEPKPKGRATTEKEG